MKANLYCFDATHPHACVDHIESTMRRMKCPLLYNELDLTSGNASQRVVEAQPETRAVMKLILERGQMLSVSLDGGALLATYPYDKPVQTGNTTQVHINHTHH